MARLNASWDNFSLRGQTWDHFWLDASNAATNPISVNPGTGELSLSGFSAIVNIDINVFPGFGEITITNYRPAAIVTESVNLYPGYGELVLSAFVPGAFGDSLRGTFKKKYAVRNKQSFGWSKR